MRFGYSRRGKAVICEKLDSAFTSKEAVCWSESGLGLIFTKWKQRRIINKCQAWSTAELGQVLKTLTCQEQIESLPSRVIIIQNLRITLYHTIIQFRGKQIVTVEWIHSNKMKHLVFAFFEVDVGYITITVLYTVCVLYRLVLLWRLVQNVYRASYFNR